MLIFGTNSNINLLGLMIQKKLVPFFLLRLKVILGSFKVVELKYTKMTPSYKINDTKCII